MTRLLKTGLVALMTPLILPLTFVAMFGAIKINKEQDYEEN